MLSRAVVVLVLLSLGSAIADDAVAAPAAAPAAAQAAPPAAAAPPAPPTSANATGSGRQADETSKVVDRVQLMRHSFESPLTFDNNLAEWDMAMSTVPAKLHVVLAPAVANRTGQLWNKTPLRTANFELYMNFTMTGPTASTTTDGFALWYVSKSYAESFPKSPAEQQAWSLFGYQSAFKGLGVFFSNHDRQGKLNPSVSLLLGDGEAVFDGDTQVPSNQGIYFPLRNQLSPLRFRLAVGPLGIHGQIADAQTGQWMDAFKVRATVRPDQCGGGSVEQ
eukprot:GHVU01041787.1.p1 GENE.GHVU01041787.1~~GHVU01041787.1.p1  ORF type:complete len:278 (+),score=53.46 GHVU01041787.1:276-1109(+)